jgi:hypothetical protein
MFTTVVKTTDEINEIYFIYGPMKRQLLISYIVQASMFHLPNQITQADRIPTKNGNPDISGWSDLEL